MRKSTVQGIVLAAISVCLTMLGLELAVRIYHGKNLFRPGGHYSPTMNHSVAEHIAAFLHERPFGENMHSFPRVIHYTSDQYSWLSAQDGDQK